MKKILFTLLFLITGVVYSQTILVDAVIYDLLTVAPTAVQGKVYYNTTDKKLYLRNDTSWVDLTAGAAGGDAWGDVVDANILPDVTGTRDLGSTALRFNDIWGLSATITNTASANVLATSAGGWLDLSVHDTPPTGEEGNLYWDDSENTLKQHNGTSWEALNTSSDNSLSEVDQTIATATNRVVNTAGSGDITFQDTSVPLLRIGNNNDNAIYIEAIEALTGNTVGSVSPLASKILDAQTDLASDYDYATIYDSGDTDAYFSDGTNWRQITPPFFDTTGVVKGEVDPTKIVRIEADSLTTATTRTIHMRDADVDLNALTTDNIAPSTIKPLDLNVDNALTDEWFFTYETTTGNFEMVAGSTPSDIAYSESTWNANTDAASKNAIRDEMEQRVPSKLAGEPTGSDLVTNIVSLTQSEYDAGSPVAGTVYIVTDAKTEYSFVVPLGAVGADLAVADDVTFVPVHDAITITRVELSVQTAPTGATIIVDIEEDDGTPATILSTLLSIDATEKWSDDAASQAVISDSAIAAKGFLNINIDQVGSTIAGADGTVTIWYTID